MDRGDDRRMPFVPTAGLSHGRVLSAVEVSTHRSLFDFFRSIRSDDSSLYGNTFDILLGTYCNAISFIRFLETGIAVAVVGTKFPELPYVGEGRIQFEYHQPMVARDGPHAVDQPHHNYMSKLLNRRSLSTSLGISTEAVSLISRQLDDTQIASQTRIRAIQQLARNVTVMLDSLERGSVNQILHILLEKAPLVSVLAPLASRYEELRLANTVMRSSLLFEIRRRVCDDTCFLSKYGHVSKERVLEKLIDLVTSTTPSVTVARMTHSDVQGRQIDGVLVTTASVHQRLSGMLPRTGDTATVPVTYGELLIKGSNLVTAVTMGKAIVGLDDVARHLLGLETRPGGGGAEPAETPPDTPPPTARVSADLVTVGDRLVWLDSYDRKVYQLTTTPYPLVGTMHVTFMFPVGLYKPVRDRYTRQVGNYGPPPGHPDPRLFPPQSTHFYNREGALTTVTLEDCMGTVCHPSFLHIGPTLAALCQEPPEENPGLFGAYVSVATNTPLIDQLYAFFNQWHVLMPARPRWVRENCMTLSQFLSPSNIHLPLELYPSFDLFCGLADVPLPGPANPPQVMSTFLAMPRIVNGNLPIPLCSIDFRDSRGWELAVSHHRLRPETIAAVRSTFEDPNYPIVFYVIEAGIHGSELLFCTMLRMVMQCVQSYWNTMHRVAFVNSFHMLAYIVTYLCGGDLSEDCAAVYKDLWAHLQSLRALVTEYTPSDTPVGDQSHEALNHLLLDPAFPPPILCDCDPLIYLNRVDVTRTPTAHVHGTQFTLRNRLQIADVNFQRLGSDLVHGQALRDDGLGPMPQGGVPHHSEEWNILAKIYYYVIVTTFSRGRCCTMGVHYERLYTLLQSVVVPPVPDNQESPVDVEEPLHPLNARNLVPNSLNVMFHNGRVTVDGEALLLMQEVMTNMAERSSVVLVSAGPDAGMCTAGTQHMRTYDGTLHHGLLMMQFPGNDETFPIGTLFYPVPVCAPFACPDHLAALPNMGPRVQTMAHEAPPIPPFCGANYFSHLRQPIVHHLRNSPADENALTWALMASFFKLTPFALMCQLRTGFHPGFGLTVVRQDTVMTENAVFAERASESYFLGQVQVDKHEGAGTLNFTLTQPRAHVDLGIGYTATYATVLLRSVLTDMGNLPQNLYLTRSDPGPLNDEVDTHVRDTVTRRHRLCAHGPTPLFAPLLPQTPAGTAVGQWATCQFIVTPVTCPLDYFRNPANPRGRASHSVYAGDGDGDPELLMYDHSQGDAAHPHVATHNPWASQRHSYGDRLYNGAYNLNAPTVHSPCYKFFTTTEVKARGRCLVQLLSEMKAALTHGTTMTEVQFRSPPGTSALASDPSALLQEAYSPFCASDPALLRSQNPDGADHYAQYRLQDKSPLAGCLPSLP